MQEVVLKTASCRGRGSRRAKIGSCVFHSSLLLYEKGPDENAFSSGPLLYRRYAYPAEGQGKLFLQLVLFPSLILRKGKSFLMLCFAS